MQKKMTLIAMILVLACLAGAVPGPETVYAEDAVRDGQYSLDKVVTLSRHSIRSPLTGGGSVLEEITPHSWFEWTSEPSELSLRGAVLETMMGQYFRLWMEDEGLIPKNWRPKENEARFYANAKQRTQATARYFSAGLLPVCVVPIEMNAPYDTMDDTFNPVIRFFSETYEEAALAQITAMGGDKGLAGCAEKLKDAIALLMDVTDMDQSEAYRAGKYGDLTKDENIVSLVPGKEPGISGPIRTATSVADALILQYYEEPDALKAAFGHELTWDGWCLVAGIVENYLEILYTAPLVSVNAANPLLKELKSELEQDGRVFSFLCGHDSNVGSVLAALNVEPYELPGTLETRTPIGVKLTFERWLDTEGAAWYRVSLVYQSTEQLRNYTPLTLETPPMKVPLSFQGVETNANGLIAEADLLARFLEAIDAFDALQDEYADLDEAA